jgi:hypothetical protein
MGPFLSAPVRQYSAPGKAAKPVPQCKHSGTGTSENFRCREKETALWHLLAFINIFLVLLYHILQLYATKQGSMSFFAGAFLHKKKAETPLEFVVPYPACAASQQNSGMLNSERIVLISTSLEA